MERHTRPGQELCYTDVGGTFTDTFVVDDTGEFILAKARTSKDVSTGYLNSLEVAAEELGISLDELLSQLSVIGYGSTVAINAIINRSGVKVGALVTKGFEHVLFMERGKQTWVGQPFADRTHVITHRRSNPLVPYHLIRGVTERIDCLGKVLVPLYEHEVRRAAEELIAQGVEAIAICFIYCWQNPAHEMRAKDIVSEVAQKLGRQVSVYASVEVSPTLREFPRLNSTIVEAYIAPIAQRAFTEMERRLQEHGFKSRLQIMRSSGGLGSATQVKLVETLESGPVGGLIGTRYIGQLYGIGNLISTDVGGTSFDVGLVTGGRITVDREPEVAGLLLNVPVAEVNSIGAGGGTLVRINPLSGRLEVGPDSAGGIPGPVCYDSGGEIPTVTDADLILGYIDANYFLGGRIKLNREKASSVLMKKIAKPLGLTLEETAMGIKKLIDVKMKDSILGMVAARGLEISDYWLLSFGGAGPTHVAGFTEGLPLKGVMVFPYSATFSAFGAAAADYEHNYTRGTNIVVPPLADAETKVKMGGRINQLWQMLEQEAYQQIEREGFSRAQVQLRHLAMIRYGRQLDDLIVPSPVRRLNEAADWDKLMASFEKMYEEVYIAAAKYPQAGYEIFEVGLIATVPKPKPKLKRHEPAGTQPVTSALKGRRSCWFDQGLMDTPVYAWKELQAGNQVGGPAIVESPTTTMVVPPDRSIAIDEYLTVWLK